MNYIIRWTPSGFSVHFEGNVTFKDIEDSGNVLYGDSRFDNVELAIFDYSNATTLDLSIVDLRIISTLDIGASRWNDKLKLALVTNKNNPKITKICNTYKRFMKENNWKIEIFEDVQDALKWD